GGAGEGGGPAREGGGGEAAQLAGPRPPAHRAEVGTPASGDPGGDGGGELLGELAQAAVEPASLGLPAVEDARELGGRRADPSLERLFEEAPSLEAPADPPPRAGARAPRAA